jgi:hypothetical protein
MHALHCQLSVCHWPLALLPSQKLSAPPLLSAIVVANINIRVYAQFVSNPPPNGDEEQRGWLDSSNWKWTNCLTFPVENLNTFSRSPYKWIRYATGIVVGAHGHLFPQQDSATPIVYDTPFPCHPSNYTIASPMMKDSACFP